MKKIIGLLAIVLFTTNLFSQKQGRFNDYPSFVNVDETRIRCIQRGGDLNEYLNLKTYSFYGKNGKLYLISYKDEYNSNNFPTLHCGGKIERNLYLLRYDEDKWNIASDVIQTDYEKADSNYYSYTYLRRDDLKELINVKSGVSNGYVKKLNNDNIEIRLLIFTGFEIYKQNGDHSWEIKHGEDYTWKTWCLIPERDGTYKIKELKN